jgi:hypothetical protein
VWTMKKTLYLVDYTWWDPVEDEMVRNFESVSDAHRVIMLASKLIGQDEKVHTIYEVSNLGEIREMKLVFDGRLKLVPVE